MTPAGTARWVQELCARIRREPSRLKAVRDCVDWLIRCDPPEAEMTAYLPAGFPEDVHRERAKLAPDFAREHTDEFAGHVQAFVQAVRRGVLRHARDQIRLGEAVPGDRSTARWLLVWEWLAPTLAGQTALAVPSGSVDVGTSGPSWFGRMSEPAATTFFPVCWPNLQQGAVVRLEVYLAATGDEEIAIAPWSIISPRDWSDFQTSYSNHGKSLIQRAAAALANRGLAARPSPEPESYLLAFDPVDPNTFADVQFEGASFGFAALLGVVTARHAIEMSTVVSTGELDPHRPGPVAGLRPKALGVRQARGLPPPPAGRRGLPAAGLVTMLIPDKEYFNRNKPLELGGKPTNVEPADIERFCQNEGLPITEHVRLVRVHSWDTFFGSEEFRDLSADPFGEYHERLRTLLSECSLPAGWDDAPPHADPAPHGSHRLLICGPDDNPFPVAVWAAVWADQGSAPGADRPVAVFIDLAGCKNTPGRSSGDDDVTSWLRERIVDTHRLIQPHLSSLDLLGYEGALRNRVANRSRLVLVVFSRRPESEADPRPFRDEKQAVEAICRYADRGGLPVVFVGNDSSHANMIRSVLGDRAGAAPTSAG